MSSNSLHPQTITDRRRAKTTSIVRTPLTFDLIAPEDAASADQWRMFTTAVRLLPDHTQRIAFALSVLGHLIDSGAVSTASLMAACDTSLVAIVRRRDS